MMTSGRPCCLDEVGGEHVLHVAGVEVGVRDVVDGGIHAGVGHGLLHVLHAYYPAGLAGHEAGNSAGAGVEVVHQFIARKLGEVAGYLIQVVGARGVGLVERLWPDPETQPFHLLVDVGLTSVADHIQIVEGFVALVVEHVVEGGDLREPLGL